MSRERELELTNNLGASRGRQKASIGAPGAG